jgi:hypothetical protein
LAVGVVFGDLSGAPDFKGQAIENVVEIFRDGMEPFVMRIAAGQI